MPLERLEAEITELAGHLAAAECRWLLLIAEYDRRKGYEQWGCHSLVQWLGWQCSLDARAARERVRVARALESLALLTEKFASGQLSYSKTRALTRIATPANEADLIMIAEHATSAELERVVRSYRRVLSNEEECEESNERHAQRFFRLDPCDDGSFAISGRLPAESAALVMAALQAAQHVATEQAPTGQEPVDKGGPAGPPDGNLTGRPDVAATNADALVMMAESFLANGANTRSGGERHAIVLNVDAEVLINDGEGACELDGGPSVAPETARRLACDASVVVMSEDEDGQPRQHGPRTRTIPPSTRRAVRLRDQGCRFPGCGSRTFVDVHHIEHWAHGGTHAMSNLVQLCWHHHRLVHEGGWGLRLDDKGDLLAIRPNGDTLHHRCGRHRRSHGGAIEHLNRNDGLCINSETCVPHCYGDRLDLDHIITGLWYTDHPPSPPSPPSPPAPFGPDMGEAQW